MAGGSVVPWKNSELNAMAKTFRSTTTTARGFLTSIVHKILNFLWQLAVGAGLLSPILLNAALTEKLSTGLVLKRVSTHF